ncbi:hypothetical protein EA462_07810 [Natrarchaeobius halalkaliphilus]|uniref:ArsR family transcriptional regulator n=1 Tax=Natrarchaeobius halalkaliphilus TaxID=1679091 RepID=A0A3N6LLW3_9EURY|nr:hypothetical protein [Natrarchaeobius halalkaliphilus]RQG89908.1 hypothetical protein EA462_07810 [Natrarchaeobius halalkaliphilus]
MTIERVRDTKHVIERWDDIFTALSAEPRRQLIVTLMNAPAGRRVLLPDAATTAADSFDLEQLRIQLIHHHLPMLAECGFVDWSTDPFCAQRGVRFVEVATIFTALEARIDEIPDQLIDGYQRFEEKRND